MKPSSTFSKEEPPHSFVEVLLLHHNRLTALPQHLFTVLNRLKVLNVSSNQLTTLPGVLPTVTVNNNVQDRQIYSIPSTKNNSVSVVTPPSLQELYAANNRLRDLTPLQHCRALKVLHAPYNRINTLVDRLIWSWEHLEELVLSGNHLPSIPTGISRLCKLRVLKVHSNPLTTLPRLSHLSALKIVDASHCQLGRLGLEDLVSPGLLALDISANSTLSLDQQQFSKCKSQRSVSVVDTTSQAGRRLPFNKPKAPDPPGQSQRQGERNTSEGNDEQKSIWNMGFAESIGRDNKLPLGQLRIPCVGESSTTGLAVLADGGKDKTAVNNILPRLPTLLKEEKAAAHTKDQALKYALLTALRNLRSQGTPVPTSVMAAHLESSTGKSANSDDITLRLCCYGDIKACVTTQDKPIVISSKRPKTTQIPAVPECSSGNKCEVLRATAITLPDPNTSTLHLHPGYHQALVIASDSIWDVLSMDEVSSACEEKQDPGLAAKCILDLAQAYGSQKPLSVLVVRLTAPNNQPSIKQTALPVKSSRHLSSRDNKLMTDSNSSSSSESWENKNFSEREKRHRQRWKASSSGKSWSQKKEEIYYSDVNSARRSAKNYISDIRPGSVFDLRDLDRYPPSGQSQSDDNSENGSDRGISSHKLKHLREPNIPTRPKVLHHHSLEDLYSKPIKRSQKSSSSVTSSQTSRKSSDHYNRKVTSGQVTRPVITYYHYPTPDPSQRDNLHEHLTNHLLAMGSERVLAPPAGFADSDTDSGSDSGLSGVSGQRHSTSPDSPSGDSVPEHVTEEQFRSWEYLLARNAKLLYMRELDTLAKNGEISHLPTASAPDLVMAAKEETDNEISSVGHFQRNNIRKSRLSSGTLKLIQSKINATTSKFNTLRSFNSGHKNASSPFKRFGSLQNLKYYQENRPHPTVHHPLMQDRDLTAEMQERPTLNSLELETRMHHYWHTGVTNF
ncbi:unnamed protein product [Meganyctiphanes norvegica]|uniref:PPM-type phosphatase domain-containing protein n=1 Tax=Meganyctiphanes norvegica TaxID=48144 RepID=A0AAV2PUV4_MEGNR